MKRIERSNQIMAYLPFILFLATASNGHDGNLTNPFHVGVILDFRTLVGKMARTSISMAIDDFYAVNGNYTTRLVLHKRDSNNDVIQAAASAIDLLENTQVQAIIGPQNSAQAVFLSGLANKSQVPLLSFSATSPFLSQRTPYFIQTTINDSTQVAGPLKSIINAFGWREVVLVYEDTDYGRDILPYLIDAFQEIGASIPYRSLIPPSCSDDHITSELYKLMTMETRVFIVHMSAPMGARFFPKAKDVGMMSEGYVWIMTDGLTNIVDSLNPPTIDSMQGTLGVKLHVPKSNELEEFTIRWRRRFLQENSNDQPAEPGIFALWAYDTVWALALAAEKIGTVDHDLLQKAKYSTNSTNLQLLGISSNGPKLLKAILQTRFTGVSGPFILQDGQLQSSTFQIINVIGKGERCVGFWTPKYGISRHLNPNMGKPYSNLMTDLSTIIWPGDSTTVPKGWESPTSGTKLRIGVPIRDGFKEFVRVERDPLTNETSITGYCIDVFESILKDLPYALPHEYIPFGDAQGHSAGTYNDLVYQVYLKNFDAVVGDTTIRANRSKYVDFTLPYTESGVSMIVTVKESAKKNTWIFLKPLTMDLWLGSFAFFFFTGFVVWVIEHRINTDFRGPFSEQLGTIFYFAFSMLVFAHREKVHHILSRLVVITWVFVVLILTSSYTASLSSMLTVQKLQPTTTDVHELRKNGDYVGYHRGSFVEGLLKQLKFDESKLRAYDYPQDYVEALSKGSRNGGVSAIVHEIPYIKLFLAHHCTGYTMVGPIYKTAGFGFVFPKGSPLVPDISRGILNVTEGDTIIEIEKKWFGDHTACVNEGSTVSSDNLSFRSFSGLFLITGVTSLGALLIFLATFFRKNWHQLRNADPDKSIWQRPIAWFRYYNKKDLNSYTFGREKTIDANGDGGVNKQCVANIEGSLEGHEQQNRLSISNFLDANSCAREEGCSSAELASGSTEAQQVFIFVAT